MLIMMQTPPLSTLISQCGKKIERPEVVTRLVSRVTSLSERESMEAYRALLSVIAEQLRAGHPVEVEGVGILQMLPSQGCSGAIMRFFPTQGLGEDADEIAPDVDKKGD